MKIINNLPKKIDLTNTYQKKLGIGEFEGNIDAIKENSICTFWANKCSGHFPPSNFEGLYILKTEHTADGEGRQFSVQTAYPLGGAGEGRVSVRMIYGEADSADPTGSTGTWIEIPSEFTIKDFDIDFASKDDENPASWTAMGKIASGKLKDLFGSVSLMAKNLRYLWKLCGTTNIASIGGGTLTGAVSKLNTDLQYRDISKEAVIINPSVTLSAYIEGGMVYARSFIPANLPEQNGLLFQLPEKYAPRLPVHAPVAYFTNADDVGEMVGATVSPDGKVVYYQTHPLVSYGGFIFQYPLGHA